MQPLKVNYADVQSAAQDLEEAVNTYQRTWSSIQEKSEGTYSYEGVFQNFSSSIESFMLYDMFDKLGEISRRLLNFDAVLRTGEQLIEEADEAALTLLGTVPECTPPDVSFAAVPGSTPNVPGETPEEPNEGENPEEPTPGETPPWYNPDTDFGSNDPQYKKYKELYENLKDLSIGSLPNIDGLSSSSGPNSQGFTDAGNYIVQSSGDGTLWIRDKATGELIKSVGVGSHLGGLSYSVGADGTQYVYAATGNTVSQYRMDDLLNGDNNPTTFINSQATGNNNNPSVSFIGMTPGDSRMLTGQFHVTDSQTDWWKNNYGQNGGAASDLQIYDTNDLNSSPKVVHVPGEMSNLQGGCIYKKDGQDYYLLVSSAGRKSGNSSTIYVATLDENSNTLVRQGTFANLPSGAEQISVTDDGNLALTFEGLYSRDNIAILDPNKLLNSDQMVQI